MIFFYCRVSTEQQSLDRQLDLLNSSSYKADKIITEKYSGTKRDRAGLNQLMDMLRPDDILVVESISRLGRKTVDILSILETFNTNNIKLVSLKENIDTTTATGKAMLQMISVISELERNLISERIQESLEVARKNGKQLGRPRVDKDLVRNALRLYDEGWSVKDIIQTTGISQGSLYRSINKRKELNIVSS